MDTILETGTFGCVYVRDVALATARAMGLKVTTNKRFLVTAGRFSNEETGSINRKTFPEFGHKAPTGVTPGGDYSKEGLFVFDYRRSREVLGITYRPLEQSVTDTVNSSKGLEE